MPENPSNDYNQDILKAFEGLMAQDPLEDNIFIKLIQDNQPKNIENHESKLNLADWAKFALFNPRNALKLSPLYNNSKEIITPAFQAALLQSPVTKDFITRIAGNKKIRDSFAKEIDCLFQKDGVLDNNGAESLGKALSVGNSATKYHYSVY
ncbi:MAG: hypothetical protein P8P83_05120 [Rickettsiaceae bacterium]|nr:hypothetical protein [Rickettsiaceae bacterium]